MLKINKIRFTICLFLSAAFLITSLAGIYTNVQAKEEPWANLFPNAFYKNFTQEQVTQGILHTDFEVFDSEGWLKGDILTVNLDDPNVGIDLLYPEKITAIATPEKMAKNAGAVAVVNGDFFDIGKTNAPIGVMIRDGEILKSSRLRGQSAGITYDRTGSIFHFLLSGIVANTSSPETPRLVLGGINEFSIIPNQLFMYTSDWGTRSRTSLVKGHSLFAEVVVKNNKVVQVLENSLYTQPLEDDMYLLLGLDGAAKVILEGYKPGDVIDISIDSSIDPSEYEIALGGDVHLVVDGKPKTFPTNPYRHPRTAMGFSQDGKTMYLAVVDGRQKDSRGMSYDEMAQFMASLGAWSAINLDSGGSTQMLSRPLGKTEIELANSPSDGRQRSIPNAVGLFTNAPTGNLLGFKIETLSNRIFSGLSRTFNAIPYDEYYNPISVEEPLQWSTDNPSLGWFEKEGLMRGFQEGSGSIVVSVANAKSSYPVKVLGDPVKIFTDSTELYIEKNSSKTFKVYALNKAGYHAPVESQDINLVYDNTLLDITPLCDHSFKVTSKMDSGTALIEIQAGGLKTWIGVASGYETVPVTGFEPPVIWTFDKFPEEVEGSASLVLDPIIRGMALRLDYNFTKTTKTRAAYMIPVPGPLPLPDGTQKLGLQVFGTDGNGHWLRGVVKDSTGDTYTIDFAKSVDWEGWKYVEATIPSKVKFPAALEKIYLVSIDPDNLTAGSIVIDELIAKIPHKIELPAEMTGSNVILDKPTPSFDQGLKFTVLSGIEMDVLNPDKEYINTVEKALNNVKQHNIDLALVTGNTVAYDSIENYIAAKQLLDQNLSPIPYYVIPGSKDIKGTDSLNNFKQTFGEDFKIIDIDGTRFLLLNMATGSWRKSNVKQWDKIIDALNEAAYLPTIKNVAVVNSLPIPNGVTLKTVSGISDSKEAELLKKLLIDFREKSDKPVAFISDQGEFRVEKLDGITYINVGTQCPVISINPDADEWIQVLRNSAYQSDK